MEGQYWGAGFGLFLLQMLLFLLYNNHKNHLILIGEISCYKDEIETELEKSRPKLRGIYTTFTKESGLFLSHSF